MRAGGGDIWVCSELSPDDDDGWFRCEPVNKTVGGRARTPRVARRNSAGELTRVDAACDFKVSRFWKTMIVKYGVSGC